MHLIVTPVGNGPCYATPIVNAVSWFLVCEAMKRPSIPTESHDHAWKDRYMEALFERDRTKLGERIAIAQRTIGERKRQLLVSGADSRERQALDNAAFSLQALATCLLITPAMARRAQAA